MKLDLKFASQLREFLIANQFKRMIIVISNLATDNDFHNFIKFMHFNENDIIRILS